MLYIDVILCSSLSLVLRFSSVTQQQKSYSLIWVLFNLLIFCTYHFFRKTNYLYIYIYIHIYVYWLSTTINLAKVLLKFEPIIRFQRLINSFKIDLSKPTTPLSPSQHFSNMDMKWFVFWLKCCGLRMRKRWNALIFLLWNLQIFNKLTKSPVVLGKYPIETA